MKLVLEGGGVRAAYQSGVLHGLVQEGVNITAVIGSSSGSLNAAFLAAEQTREACETWLNYVPGDRFINYRRQFTPGAGPGLNVDDLVDKLLRESGRLTEIKATEGKIALYLTATDIDNDCGVVKRPTRDNFWEWLRASLALPVGYNKVIQLEGKRFIDGGIAIPCPFDVPELNNHEGPTVVVLTRPMRTRKPPPVLWERIAVRLIVPPEARKICLTQHHHHNHTMDRLGAAVAEKKVILIDPPEDLPLARLTKDPVKIRKGVEMGIEIGKRFAEKMRNAAK